MLNEQILQDLKTKRADVCKLLDRTASAIDEASTKRRAKLDNAVARVLPQVSKKVMAYLRETYPEFLTPDRVELFEKHGVILGVFNRATTKEALRLLQSQFSAFLAKTDFCAAEDTLLRDLAAQKARLARELQLIAQLLPGSASPTQRRFEPRYRSSGSNSGPQMAYVYDSFQPGDGDDDLLSTVLYIAALEAQNQDTPYDSSVNVQVADSGPAFQPDSAPVLDLSNPVLCAQDVNGNVDCAPIDAAGTQGDACVVVDDNAGYFS
jgi:hypothetical protein